MMEILRDGTDRKTKVSMIERRLTKEVVERLVISSDKEL